MGVLLVIGGFLALTIIRPGDWSSILLFFEILGIVGGILAITGTIIQPLKSDHLSESTAVLSGYVGRKDLKLLFKTSIEQYRYSHGDVWRGQQFYTTLNTSILAATVALVRLGTNAQDATVLLFFIGAVASLFGFLTIRRLRRYFLESMAHLALIERLLNFDSKLTAKGLGDRMVALSFTEPLHRTGKALEDRDSWVEDQIYRRGGVTYYFLWLQGVFLALNVIGSALVLSGLL